MAMRGEREERMIVRMGSNVRMEVEERRGGEMSEREREREREGRLESKKDNQCIIQTCIKH